MYVDKFLPTMTALVAGPPTPTASVAVAALQCFTVLLRQALLSPAKAIPFFDQVWRGLVWFGFLVV